MKIKNPSSAQLRKARLRAINRQYWLIPEPPKGKGRLSQLNKANTKARTSNALESNGKGVSRGR